MPEQIKGNTQNVQRLYAGLAGLLYLTIIITAGFSEGYVRSSLVVTGDAATTAANILASEGLFRLGFLSDLLAFLSDVALAVLLYMIFRPVSKSLALIAAFFRLTQSSVLAANLLNYFNALNFLNGAEYLGVFTPTQLEAFALHALDMHAQGYVLGLMFFGMHCALLGVLIWRSGFVPKIMGVLMFGAALAYLGDGIATFILPQYKEFSSVAMIAPAVIAEFSFTIWLLFMGLRPVRASKSAGGR